MPLFDHTITTLGLEPPPVEKRSDLFGDPTTPMTAIAVWNEMIGGPTASGELISERTAMCISTVYTCVTALAEAASSLPCKLIRHRDKGREEATDVALYRLLANEPNPEMSAPTFWATMVGCSALAGNGYAQITRDPDGVPNGFWPLHPLKTEPVRLPGGKLAFRTQDGETENTYRIVPAKDILHFPLFSMDGIRGISPVRAAREAFALALAAEKFGARFFGNGAHTPSILIKKGPKPDPKAQQEFRESWQQEFGGSNAHRQAILFGDWDVKSIGVSPEDSQFLATRNFQRSDIAAMYHLQPHQVGDTSRLSNANHVQAQLSFVTDTLRPIIVRIEAELKRKLLGNSPDLEVVFDISSRLRGDFLTTQQGYQLGRIGGWLSVNDIRTDMGKNPIGPEGDTYLYPVNYANADQLLNDSTLIPTTQQPDPQEPEPVDDPQNPQPKKKGNQ